TLRRPPVPPSLSRGHAPPAASTLSLHDALPIYPAGNLRVALAAPAPRRDHLPPAPQHGGSVVVAILGRVDSEHQRVRVRVLGVRSEEHTSELQSRENLVCRLLLEKKNTRRTRRW